MMGVPLLHESWNAGVEKFVALGTICPYPNPSTSLRTSTSHITRQMPHANRGLNNAV
jgi:hypothetical protein